MVCKSTAMSRGQEDELVRAIRVALKRRQEGDHPIDRLPYQASRDGLEALSDAALREMFPVKNPYQKERVPNHLHPHGCPNEDWKKSTIEQLLERWGTLQPDMLVVPPNGLVVPRGWSLGVLPTLTYLQRSFGENPATPEGHARLTAALLHRVSEVRSDMVNNTYSPEYADARFWRPNAEVLAWRSEREKSIAGDAAVYLVNRGKATVGRSVSDVEFDILNRKEQWLGGFGTPADIAWLLIGDGANSSLENYYDLGLRGLWVRVRRRVSEAWSFPRICTGRDWNGLLFSDGDQRQGANALYGMIVVQSLLS